MVNEMNALEPVEIAETVQEIGCISIDEIGDIVNSVDEFEDYLSGSRHSINNVLLLNMSTLYPLMEETTYTNKEGEYQVTGYGQLEPLPQILAQYELKKDVYPGKTLDLIIITASEAAKKSVRFELKGKGIYEGSAVDFFKYRIREVCKIPVQFLTVDLEDDKKALLNVTRVIRLVSSRSRDNFRLFMDMHRGQRDLQLLFDGIIHVLNNENIEITKAYSCIHKRKITNDAANLPVKQMDEIIDTTEKLQVFQLASGIHEFINYGYGRGLATYIEKTGCNEWKKKLVNCILRISEALSLCKIPEFEDALDQFSALTQQDHIADDYLEIFLENIRQDYGDLLIKEDRSLYSVVAWAKKKHFYQQCLAVIEAKTPGYVFDNLIDLDTVSVERECLNSYVACDKKRFEDKHKTFRKEALSGFYFREIFYGSDKETWERPVFNYKGAGVFICKEKDKKKSKEEITYRLKMKRKICFDEETFVSFGKTWWILKDMRNSMFHVGDCNKVTEAQLSATIERYLEKLKALDGYIRENVKTCGDKRSEKHDSNLYGPVYSAKVISNRLNAKTKKRNVWIAITDKSCTHVNRESIVNPFVKTNFLKN